MSSLSFKPEYFQVYTGEDRDLPLRIINIDGTPFSLVGATEIEARFKKADGGVLSKKLTTAGIVVGSDILGKITVKLTAADTALLLVGAKQSFTVHMTLPTGIRKVNYATAITVERSAV